MSSLGAISMLRAGALATTGCWAIAGATSETPASKAIRWRAFTISPRAWMQSRQNAAIRRRNDSDKDERMRATGFAFVTFITMLVSLTGLARADSLPPADVHHLAITLVAETDSPKPGSDVTVALDTRPEAGWHGYWSNPGDAGFPDKLDWTLPQGITAGAATYPMPSQLLIAGLMNYVYEKPYAPLVTLHIPAGIPAGTKLPIELHMSYLVCSASICVPESADLSLDLTAGDGHVAPDRQSQFDAWRQAQPKPIGTTATYQAANGGFRIAIPYPAAASLDQAYFFPATTGFINYAAPQTVTRDGDR